MDVNQVRHVDAIGGNNFQLSHHQFESRTAPPPNKIVSIVRKPATGPPYTLRFQMMGATEEECGEDQLHNWLLPLIEDRQRAVAKRMGLPENVIDPRFQSASASHDGAGAMLKAVRKWMATTYLNKHGTCVIVTCHVNCLPVLH